MRGAGYGQGRYGKGPYGHTDWCYYVMYKELPAALQKQDKDEGGYYEKFVKALCIPFNRMRSLINNYSSLVDPLSVRIDLLKYYSASYGLEADSAEAETFQRTSADMFGRFRFIKGTASSFVVLAKVHGFDATVQELWWNGTELSSTQTPKVGEVVGVIL
jgi:hypothetical protein